MASGKSFGFVLVGTPLGVKPMGTMDLTFLKPRILRHGFCRSLRKIYRICVQICRSLIRFGLKRRGAVDQCSE